jgi:hypothetical protein
LPAVVFTQPAGADPSAIASKVSFHGIGRTTRTRDCPLRAPTVALTSPACSIGSLATVNAPPSTVPFKPSSDHCAG